ncbi:MAG: HEAT repeat domain-containing protein [Trueperaceae bacterium]
MWRQTGAGFGVFGVIAALTFALIGAGLVVLFVSFIQPSERDGIRILMTLTLLPAAAAFLLLLFQFGYHLFALQSVRTERLERARLDAWVAYVVHEGVCPPLDLMSASALARLRETTSGSYSDGLADLYRQNGFLRRDIEALASRQYAYRSSALSRLGQIREPGAIPALQGLLAAGVKSMATEVLRTLARSLDAGGMTLETAIREFKAACDARNFSSGEIESALVLTGRHSAGLVRDFLEVGREPIAALTVLGHNNLLELVPLLARYLRSEDPEIRAAALRTIAKVELAPRDSSALILEALEARQSFVRAQAAKASVTVPMSDAEGPLVRALGDRDWWVRRNAAASLAAFGPAGKAVLARVALSHSDPFARESARRAVQ